MLGTMGKLLRNAAAGGLGALFTYGFWLSRPEWDPEMRLWRAVGDAGLILLFLALAVGPLVKLWTGLGRVWLVLYRRELGVWFGFFALLHTLLVLNGWARWDARRFLGYEYVPQLGRLARLEPGFGLANLIGLVAMLMSSLLMVTSTDWAVRRLGSGAWKFLQYSAYTVFYLSALHSAYFLFMHYTESFHRAVPDTTNWFRYPFLALTLLVAILQTAAYCKGVTQRRQRQRHVPIAGGHVADSG